MGVTVLDSLNEQKKVRFRRSRLTIKMHILKIYIGGEIKTGIFYASRLSYSQCMKYVKELKELGFLAYSQEIEGNKRGVEISTTANGLRLLGIYERIAKHLCESEKR
jgi:predicted transcriptional regulator